MLRYDTHMHLALRAAGYSTSDLEEICRRIQAVPSHLAVLRDEFAKAAITGTLPGRRIPDEDVQEYARWAYRVADAMLAERAKGGAQ